jgi:glycerol dehydrogenase-like iron-containing ADH family enzyme
MVIKDLLEERNIELRYVGKNYNFPELRDGIVITNDDYFTKNFLLNLGIKEFYTIKKPLIGEVKKIEGKIKKKKAIVGFGGGVAIDTAKKISFDLDTNLISIPTAPTHDGLISKNCSLYDGNKKKSIPTKYPEKLIISLYLWKNSGDLKKAGICDLISNLIALQDLSLAEKKGEKFSDFYKKLSFEAVKKVLNSEDYIKLSEGLILSGLAMEESSIYCSGSEHEVEKLFEKKGLPYLHGQLVGTGILISAQVYAMYHEKLPELRFNSRDLFDDIKEKMMKKKVYEFALKPLLDKNFKSDILREVSEVRPERYNLWNVIDSRKVNWDSIVNEILKN